ncbi:MAG: class I tRNA ligase family protein, partial [Euryarchaeota archaeon]|nr:class I tRNA ligase family protein [Euryarchaeota archaeon]
DCWFDSGCASFAQWHHPFGAEGKFENNFPIDYICEGVDQTRGWFYTLLAVSTTVFESICYKRCLSLGLILDAEGKKMSKSKGNIVDPWDHFNREGADATRWYMVTAGAPWNPMKFDPNGVRETYGKMFLTLWNIYRFHSDYAALDGFDPEASPQGKKTPLDAWVLSRLAEVVKGTDKQFEEWDFHKACRDIEEFVVNDVSNWYVRRSRRRLWDEADGDDKLACQHTLHTVLVTISRLMAPVSPFMPDTIHRNLMGTSVHLADWPESGDIDSEILETMTLVRELAETGRRIRVDADRRQRLPCAEGWIVSGPDLSPFHEILAEELNVEIISLETDLDRFQKIEVVPNRRSLGAKCRQDLPAVLQGIADGDSEAMLASIEAGNLVIAGYEIGSDDIELRRVERQGYAAQTVQIAESSVSLVLDMSDTPELLSKGLARDITRRIQASRKDLNLAIVDTISLEVGMKDAPELFAPDRDWIANETRANSVQFHLSDGSGESFEVDGATIWYTVTRS